MILVELTAAIDAAGTLTTFYVGTDGFVTSPSDTPSNMPFIPALVDPGSLGTSAYSDGRTGGGTKLETGEIVIANVDGQFDAWLNYSFDGRPVTIRSGTAGVYPGAFPAVFVGTVESIEATWRTIIVRLRDKQYVFDKPALTTTYAGTNALPAGLEGTPTDVAGKVKPRTIGTVYNVSPPQVNTSKLTYQVNSGAVTDIPAVYDRGASITKGADYANSTLMQAAVPGAGTYITCFAEGYFRLGSSAAGQITADVVQGAAVGNRTVAQMIKQLGLDAGLSSGEISGADVTALDTANSSVVGIWINSDATFMSIMDSIAASVGAWYGFDGTGVLRLGTLTAPAGTPVVTLYDYDIGEAIERRPAKDNGLPVWRVSVNHTKIWTVQPSDLAGSVTAATRAYLADQYRAVNSADVSVKTQWLLATEISVDSLLTSASDATTEAARQLALQKVRRDIFDVPVDLSVVSDNSLKFMDVIGLQIARFGLDSGKSFRLIGKRITLQKNQAILTLWG